MTILFALVLALTASTFDGGQAPTVTQGAGRSRDRGEQGLAELVRFKLNLADLAVAGDGTLAGSGGRRAMDRRLAPEKFLEVPSVDAVDGIFVPDPSKPTRVSSTGIMFDFTGGVGSGLTTGRIASGPAGHIEDPSSRISGAPDYSGSDHALLEMHACSGITFDLAAVKARLGTGARITALTATALSPTPPGTSWWVIVDGGQRAHGILEGRSMEEIRVAITPRDRFLTLATGDGGRATINWAHAGFGDPFLHVEAEETGAPPTDPSPASGAEDARPWAPLRWRAGPGVVRHEVFLWKDGRAAPEKPMFVVDRPEAWPRNGLDFGTGYRWRVRMKTGSGRTLHGPEWSFRAASRGPVGQRPPFDISPAAREERARRCDVGGIERLVGVETPLVRGMTIAWFGDSVTDVTRYQRFVEEAVRTAPRTRELGIRFLNRGINGGKAEDLVTGTRRWGPGGGLADPPPIEEQLAADEPDAVVIFIGVNEPNDLKAGGYPSGRVDRASPPTSNEDFRRHIETLVSAALARGAAVVLGTPAVWGERPDGANRHDARLDTYAEICREVAERRKAAFVDVRGRFLDRLRNENWRLGTDDRLEIPRDRGILTGDGIHPNEEGCRFLSELFADGLVRALVARAEAAPPAAALVPWPREVELSGAKVAVPSTVSVHVGSEALRDAADALAHDLRGAAGIRAADDAWTIELTLDAALPEEGYRVAISARGASIRGGSSSGVHWGAVTLIQLLEASEIGARLPVILVEDRPHAPYRAVMVDCARNHQSIATLEATVRLARFHKIRYVQLHLTDDQAFTFPSAAFPGLSGSSRFSYSRAELDGLVAFAERNGVTLIPELEVPGHAGAMLRGGNGVFGDPKHHVVNLSSEETLTALRTLLGEICEVFNTSPYVHIGGDESAIGNLARYPGFEAARRRSGLRSAYDLYCHGIDALNHEIRRLGRTTLVWEGFHGDGAYGIDAKRRRISRDVVVLAWESSYNPPWSLLDAGFEIINASWRPLYIVGGGLPRHPHVHQKYWPLAELYDWNKDLWTHWQPGRPTWNVGPGGWRAPDAQRPRVRGAQICIWEQREHSVVPLLWDRIAPVAEKLWNPDAGRGLQDFRRRHVASRRRIQPLVEPVGITPSDPRAVDHHRFTGTCTVELTNLSRWSGTLRFTLDERSVRNDSPSYAEPIRIDRTTTLRAALFGPDGNRIGGETFRRYSNEPYRARHRLYRVGRDPTDRIPDFASMKPYEMGYLHSIRGPYTLPRATGQVVEATIAIPETAEWDVEGHTDDGYARIIVDGNVIIDRTRPGKRVRKRVALSKGRHELRVEHVTGALGCTLMVGIAKPGTERIPEVTRWLLPIDPD